jgi:hypothetical protein
MTDRKKPGVAFWATVVVVVVLMAYPLSFGPACWLVSHADLNEQVVNIPYRPVLFTSQVLQFALDGMPGPPRIRAGYLSALGRFKK